MTGIYQTVMTNFGITKYSGNNVNEAILIAARSGYQCQVLKDGALIGVYCPIGGWNKTKI